MKVTKEHIIGFIIGFVIIQILMFLLCGAAQACDSFSCNLSSKVTTPDSVILHFECGETEQFHLRAITPDDWCVGRVDTTRSGYGVASDYPRYDTTWVRCCDSAARGLSPIDRRYTLQHPKRWYIESVDTTWGRSTYKGEPCRLFHCDTIWAKKIPLADVWLTPEEMKRVKQLLK